MNATELNTEDLITPQDMVVTMSHAGYVKSQPLSEYRAQKRGGRGKQATSMKDDDWIDTLFIANTHDHILCFSNRGRVYWLKVYNVPQGSRACRFSSRRLWRIQSQRPSKAPGQSMSMPMANSST